VSCRIAHEACPPETLAEIRDMAVAEFLMELKDGDTVDGHLIKVKLAPALPGSSRFYTTSGVSSPCQSLVLRHAVHRCNKRWYREIVDKTERFHGVRGCFLQIVYSCPQVFRGSDGVPLTHKDEEVDVVYL
ncbi:hypothetical protein KIPB_007125, partial [Kipferlia bialata]